MKYMLYRNLGACLVVEKTEPTVMCVKPINRDKYSSNLDLLSDVWKVITKFSDPNVIMRRTLISLI